MHLQIDAMGRCGPAERSKKRHGLPNATALRLLAKAAYPAGLRQAIIHAARSALSIRQERVAASHLHSPTAPDILLLLAAAGWSGSGSGIRLCRPAGAKSLRKAAQDGLPGSHNLHSRFPLSAIFASGVIETISQIKWLQDQQGEILAAAYEFISRLHIPPVIFEEFSRGMENLLAMGLYLLASLPLFSLGTALTMGLANSAISLCVFYFLLLDAERLAKAFMALQASKSRDFDRKCLEKIDRILSGIYMGSICTAIAGGLTSAAIFII